MHARHKHRSCRAKKLVYNSSKNIISKKKKRNRQRLSQIHKDYKLIVHTHTHDEKKREKYWKGSITLFEAAVNTLASASRTSITTVDLCSPRSTPSVLAHPPRPPSGHFPSSSTGHGCRLPPRKASEQQESKRSRGDRALGDREASQDGGAANGSVPERADEHVRAEHGEGFRVAHHEAIESQEQGAVAEDGEEGTGSGVPVSRPRL